MPQEWYIDYGTQIDGPLSSRDLQDRASSGRLRPTDRVSPDRQKWAEATKVKGLRFPPTTEPDPTPLPNTIVQSASLDPNDLPPTNPAIAMDAPDIPGYEILGQLGFGGCGVVYRARQLKLDRIVALKTVQMTGRPDAKLTARFEKEAVSLAKLQHPNIVSIFDSGRYGELVFFAMELLKGEDLGHRIGKDKRLDERTVWAIARQTAAALAHAAGEGIYHRDIKPANLFLVPMPTGFGLPADLPLVKVTDFGLALTRRESESVTDDRLTAAGMVLGTPAYMAPEQFKTPDVDLRADIYSLGATVYHALTGKPPFPGETVWDVMMKKVQGTVPRPPAPVSDATSDLIALMMAADPAARVQHYEELIARIDALPAMRGVTAGTGMNMPSLGNTTSLPDASPGFGNVPTGLIPTQLFSHLEPPPAAEPPVRRRPSPVLLGVAGAVLVGGIGIGVLAFGTSSSRTPATTAATRYKLGTHAERLWKPDEITGWGGLGGSVSLANDEEGGQILEIQNGAKRTFAPIPDFQIILGFDLYRAKAADLTVCVPDTDDESAPRLTLRVTRDPGAIIGTRTGDKGAFTASGSAVPYPTKEQLDGKVPYLEVRFARFGGKWEVGFNGVKVGTVPDNGTRTLPELRIRTEGGPVRIESVELQQLVPE